MQPRDLKYEDYAIQSISRHIKLLNTLKQGVRKGENPEAVHQWRVTSRRLRDAINVFKDLFPKTNRKAWNRSLRRLAQTAGTARDLDIHICFLKKFKHRSGIKKLLAIHQEQRKSLQPNIRKALARFEKTTTLVKIEIFLKALSNSPAKEGSDKLCFVFKKRTRKRLKKILSLKKHVSRPQAIKELHQIRIAAKHLRYTLETFEPLYGKQIHFFVEKVVSIQEILGDVHDFDVWIETLPGFASQDPHDKEFRDSLKYLREECRRLRGESYIKFAAIWKDSTHLIKATAPKITASSPSLEATTGQ